ncbi:flavin monoamine oxidase family protein [Duganella radicis]|uniref:NAD(P)-binding protein n=1 Tax=Duganella radicis TaxID=551988 RepID=A0A6L6PK91_9BURK|nr:FAD-dependent oxidoreductase [Duganella radicis]MTV39027.1 NAD(P)-binding protein [Duganella radicis]
MQEVEYAIAGGGLAGLYAAWLLERRGIQNYVVLEARARLGGRIQSFATPDGNAGFDLGPAWYWPEYQPQLAQLVSELGLASFAQHEQGEMMYERFPGEAPMRTAGYASSPQSMRLQGGMSAITEALRANLNPACIRTGVKVRRASKHADFIEIACQDTDGSTSSWRARHLLLAIPPRLVQEGIEFVPALPAAVARTWRDTATWMAPHAKYLAVYDKPFWREQGLSGEARSAVGVLGEIHDASMPGGAAALFGFFRIPVQARVRAGNDVLRDHCRAQLARLFGQQGAAPRADVIQDWALDSLTATSRDQIAEAQHPMTPPAVIVEGDWLGCLRGIASEWSPQFPGYLAGAVEAADRAIETLNFSERGK